MKKPRSKIGMLNEHSLHAALIEYVSRPEDEFEKPVGRYVVDIVREDLMIEVQTASLSSIKKKLAVFLAQRRPVRLVHPIARRKWVTKLAPDGKEISRRRSPHVGKITEIFEELVYITDALEDPHFSLDVMMVEVEEIRRDDGKGSRHRKGVSIVDTKLLEVIDVVELHRKSDYLIFLPYELEDPFTNKTLQEKAGVDYNLARQITYCLRRTGTVEQVGKKGNELLYRRDV